MNTITKPIIDVPTPGQSPHNWGWLLFLIAICTILGVVALWKDADFLDENEEGNPILSEERQRKLDDALRDLEEAEQYALRVEKTGYFPCYSCPDSTQIYLLAGETWRYGMTTKKEKGRYGLSLQGTGLIYTVQFMGTFQACLEEERRKIYNYAVLPENLKRAKPLIRPPGNKIDR